MRGHKVSLALATIIAALAAISVADSASATDEPADGGSDVPTGELFMSAELSRAPQPNSEPSRRNVSTFQPRLTRDAVHERSALGSTRRRAPVLQARRRKSWRSTALRLKAARTSARGPAISTAMLACL